MRRLFRFRLRSLFIGMLLLAAPLHWAMEGRDQAETVQLIRAAGGNVYYEFERSKLVDAPDTSRVWRRSCLWDGWVQISSMTSRGWCLPTS